MNMPQVRIATYVGTGGNQPEISDTGVKAEVIVLLRNKAPKLKTSDFGSDTLVIAVELNNMTIEDVVTDNYYGVVMAWVFREARITAINKIDKVVVWHQSYTLVSSRKEALRQVNRVLDRFMTQFAADWLLANP